jgi:hypothetical protein
LGVVEEATVEAEKHGERSSELLAALVAEARVMIEPIQQTIKWRKNEGDYKLASRLRLRVFVDVGCPVAGMTWLALEACVWRRGRGFSRAPPR